MAIVADIADALVTALKANGFPEAELRGVAYTKREEVASRKCVVMISNGNYEPGTRSDFDEVYEFYVVLQRACGPADLTTLRALLGDVETLVHLWGEGGVLRRTEMAGAVWDSGPDHPTGSLYEDGQIQDHQLFSSIIAVRYGIDA